jgi:hypothetical protein
MGIDVQLGCGHRIHLGDGSVTLGQVEHCIYCGEPSTVQYISTGMEGIVPIAQTDPGAAVSAWVERMTLRFGDKTYDQITRRDVTWIEALSLWRYGEKKEWLVAPIFTPKDIETAEVWEQHTWPTDGGWPHRFVPMERKGDLRQCLASEHTSCWKSLLWIKKYASSAPTHAQGTSWLHSGCLTELNSVRTRTTTASTSGTHVSTIQIDGNQIQSSLRCLRSRFLSRSPRISRSITAMRVLRSHTKLTQSSTWMQKCARPVDERWRSHECHSVGVGTTTSVLSAARWKQCRTSRPTNWRSNWGITTR